MGLDTAPLLAALEPPSFTHEGKTWQGRHLSILEWTGWMGRMEAFQHRKLGLIGQQHFMRDLADAWFPKPRRQWRTFWKRERSVGDIILTLPPVVQDQVLATFIRSQQRALGPMVPDAGNIRSPAPTME